MVNCVIIFISLTTLLNISIRIPGCGALSPARLDLCLASNPSLCFAVPFLPLNSDNGVISVSVDFCISSEILICFAKP